MNILNNYEGILCQIEHAEEVLDRCREIIFDMNEINKLNKLYIRANTVNSITYDIMDKIEELQN